MRWSEVEIRMPGKAMRFPDGEIWDSNALQEIDQHLWSRHPLRDPEVVFKDGRRLQEPRNREKERAGNMIPVRFADIDAFWVHHGLLKVWQPAQVRTWEDNSCSQRSVSTARHDRTCQYILRRLRLHESEKRVDMNVFQHLERHDHADASG